MATMTVQNPNNGSAWDDRLLDHSIKNLSGSLEMPVAIEDIEIYDYCSEARTLRLIITTSNNGSYQNILLFYDVQIDFKVGVVQFLPESKY